jgi:hypothetical protein
MMMRSIENTIYFASVNYALRYQESATCLIAPSGECQAFLPYGDGRRPRGRDRLERGTADALALRARALRRTPRRRGSALDEALEAVQRVLPCCAMRCK